MYEYICEHVSLSKVFDDVYVDTNSDEIKDYALSYGYNVIQRDEELAQNTANGNDLLIHHYDMYPNYDFYFQLFATAPFLQPTTIKACVDTLINTNKYDSCFTGVNHQGFFWMNNMSINYRPCILPRSQDLNGIIEETTGLYGISNEALKKYRCRIGAHPYIHIVDKFEAVDINTEEDLKIAEYIGNGHWGL